MNYQELIDAEVMRIKAGPQSGCFTFLHHQGPLLEQSDDVMERVNYILQTKPKVERHARLRHIYFVPAPAEKAYQEAKASAEKAYQEATAPAEKAILALIPNCAWNGETILA